MNEQLRELEQAARVPLVKGRSFHAFRRVVVTVLIEQLSTTQVDLDRGPAACVAPDRREAQ